MEENRIGFCVGCKYYEKCKNTFFDVCQLIGSGTDPDSMDNNTYN